MRKPLSLLNFQGLNGSLKMPSSFHPSVLLVVAAGLLDSQHRILLSQRPPGKPFAGAWEFPGGKVEKGESPEHSLQRELLEELGLFIELKSLMPFQFVSHAYTDFHLLMPLYLCRQWEGQPEAREGQSLRWVSVFDLPNFPLLEADKPLIPSLISFITHPF